MKFSLRHVEVFRAVIASGSATGAAQLLHTSQPTISRELARFEQLTQLSLFKRMGGKLVPTEQARMLYEEVDQAYLGLERIASAADAIRHFSEGQLSIACLPAFSQALLPRACRDFRARHDGVSMKIVAQEGAQLQDSLSSQRYHLGLTEDMSAPAGTTLRTLLALDVVCVLPTHHPLCGQPGSVLTPGDFAGQDFVHLASVDPYRQRVDALFNSLGITRRMVVETPSASAVCETVRAGAGIAIVNPLTALSYAGPDLQIRCFSHAIPYYVNLVRPGATAVSPGVCPGRQFCRRAQHKLRPGSCGAAGNYRPLTYAETMDRSEGRSDGPKRGAKTTRRYDPVQSPIP